MLFRPRLDGGKESCAALVCLDEENRESDCFVIAPRERVVIGNGEGCVARIPPPLLAEGESLGTVEWTPGGIRFRGARDQGAERGTLLEDGVEINLPRLTLRVKIPRKSDAGAPTPTVRYEPHGLVSGPTREKEIKKPDPDELPPRIRKLDIALGGLALVVLPLIVYLLRPDPLTVVVDRWFEACHNQLISDEGEGWTRSRSKITWPPVGLIQPCVVAPVGSVKAYRIDEDRLLGDLPEGTYLDPSRFESDIPSFIKKFENKSLLLVVFCDYMPISNHVSIGDYMSVRLTVEYYGRYEDGSRPDFVFTRKESELDRQGPRLAAAALAAMALLGMRAFAVQRYRSGRMAEYEAWQAKRTEETYELKKLLDEARKLTHAGRDAQALVLINQVLERKPSYDEAVELKRFIQTSVGAARGTLISGGPARETGGPVPADVPNLFLKILQTPYAYRAPRGFDRITLGRQRRPDNAEEGPPDANGEAGNDLVVRVPGSDRLSLRISRKHMEIQRIDKEFFVKDLSGGHTLLNGRALAKDVPYPIVSGDRLTIAGVLVLQVQIQAAVEGQVIGKIIQVQKKGSSFEATIGDMVTELPDE